MAPSASGAPAIAAIATTAIATTASAARAIRGGRAWVMGSRDDMRMPDGLIPTSLLVVFLGLLASLGWGVADFGGGLTSRSAPVLGVLGGSQLASLLVAVPVLLL